MKNLVHYYELAFIGFSLDYTMNVIYNCEQSRREQNVCFSVVLFCRLLGAVGGLLASFPTRLAFPLLAGSLVFFHKELSGFIVLLCAGICICCFGRRNG